MPYWVDRDTGRIVGYSGRKMTPEDYDRRADATIEHWMKGYTGGDFQDVLAWADIDRQRARELRAEDQV